MKVKLAEALLRRKELGEKVQLLKNFKTADLFEVKGKRVKVADDTDDLVLQVPKMYAGQVTAEHDWHAKQLRLIDAAIQQANWTTELEVEPDMMGDYTPPSMELYDPKRNSK